MNCNRFGTTALLFAIGLAAPATAIASELPNLSPQTAPAPNASTDRQVLDACIQNRAETLPNPFVDVSSNHWAFKAVLTMHYCGAYRQATPPNLVERLTNQRPTQPTPAAQ